MQDQSSDLENSHELKFSREQGFFDKSAYVRIGIGIFFVVALALFLHFREVRVEMLELNTIAPSYVVSQVDFDFLDEEATAIMRQEAVRDIGKIYKLQDKEVRQRHMEFENFLIYNQEWRKYVEAKAFDQIYSGAEAVIKVLLQLHLTDSRTVQKMKEAGLSTATYMIYTPSDLSEGVALPPQLWQYIQRTALSPRTFPDITASFIITYFQKFTWLIEEDIPTERLLRKRIQSSVPDKYTHMSAGSRIIDQGERVTTRHIAMLQAMKQALNDSRNLGHPLSLLGSLLLSLLMTILCVYYFRSNYPQILFSNRKLALIVTVIIITLALAKLIELLLLTSHTSVMDAIRYPVLVPFAAILLCSLMNPGIATFVSGFLAIVLTMTLAFERQGFLILNIAAALVAILSTHSLRQRKEIFVVCAKAWWCCIAVLIALHFSQGTFWNLGLLSDITSTGVFLLLTAVVVVGLLPLLESSFRVMTDVTLTEYMNPNSDLLRRLTLEAPGTYQHSVVVGNVAEAAAVAIGANGLFCRVATLYHDIGKMATPQYFTENQHGGVNIHQLLTPEESAAVIIAHVSEGVAMARRAGLPEPFIDIIKEHHGTTLVYYFYRKQLEKMGGDRSLVNEEAFRYAGPKPRSKESAIIMLADTIEAASRSLEKIDEETLGQLTARLVRDKLEEGQLDHCLLTLEELSVVTSSLVKTLVAYGHSRIKYPNRSLA